ncbi:MAG TPA: hypothetical protein VN577_07460 [Terriglobales bacterium]|nr:hypothetical protein [Terriglobales bacterium]
MSCVARKKSLRLYYVVLLCLVLPVAAAAQSVELQDGWKLLVDKGGNLTIQQLPEAADPEWRSARVGLSWNAQFPDLRDYMGVAWYRTQIDVPQFQSPRAVLLRFGAVDNTSEVFVNGQSAGSHEGGYTPFTLDITRLVKPGINDVAVRVVDPPMKAEAGSKFTPYDEIPHGKQNWYVQTGGIWQPVWLEFRPQTYISDLRITPRNNGNAKFEVTISGGGSENVSMAVYNNTGGIVAERTLQVSGSKGTLELTVDHPELWSPSNPALYSVSATLANGDRYTTRFGFRQFEARDGKLYLNGEPFYMRAALDQDFYPDTIYTPPSEAYVREMMLKAKALGLNLLRCHIKVCDPQYLNAADEVGMLVWYEIPSWNDRNEGNVFTMAAAERGEKIFRAMFERDWNRPSIVIASVINESWGADLRNADQRQWLKAAYEHAKTFLGDRALVVDNSACCSNFHVKSDLDDFHQYYSIPDNAHKWDKWVADFASRPKWSYSQHGDAERTGREPLIVSEFGNWGLPQLPSQLPWWFDRDFGGREVTRPAGVLDRFREYKFQRIFPDFNALALATQWHQYRSLKHEIESMRSHEPIQGYVITELTDINWEANGLMDMWRKPKAYATKLAQVQQDNVILLSSTRRSVLSGEQVLINASLSAYANADWNGAQLEWSTSSGLSGKTAINAVPKLTTVTSLPKIQFNAPQVQSPKLELLTATLTSRDGQILARNELEYYVFPKSSTRAVKSVVVHDPAKTLDPLVSQMRSSGYSFGKGNLMLSSAWDTEIETHLKNGGRALLLLDKKDAVSTNAPFKIAARAGSDLDGNWVTNFNWVVLNDAPFKGVALRPLLGFEASAVTPAFILQGIPSDKYDQVVAGIFYGWLNNNAALAARIPFGTGEALVTTFRFDQYAKDPFAKMLLDSMISLAAANGQGKNE